MADCVLSITLVTHIKAINAAAIPIGTYHGMPRTTFPVEGAVSLSALRNDFNKDCLRSSDNCKGALSSTDVAHSPT